MNKRVFLNVNDSYLDFNVLLHIILYGPRGLSPLLHLDISLAGHIVFSLSACLTSALGVSVSPL